MMGLGSGLISADAAERDRMVGVGTAAVAVLHRWTPGRAPNG